MEALETQLERPSPFAEPRRRETIEPVRLQSHTERRSELPLKLQSATRFESRPDLSRESRPERAAPRTAALQSVARDIDRTRREGDNVAAVGQIAAELQALREDMRQQMAASLTREFDTLRSEVHRLAT